MRDEKKSMGGEIDHLQSIVEKLEGDLDEKEALEFLEKTVGEVENFSKRIEEKES
jgi:hypothetical protein